MSYRLPILSPPYKTMYNFRTNYCPNINKINIRHNLSECSQPLTPNSTKLITFTYKLNFLQVQPVTRNTCGDTTISWQYVKHTITFNHVEILVLHEASHECIWLRHVIQHVQETCGFSYEKMASWSYMKTMLYVLFN